MPRSESQSSSEGRGREAKEKKKRKKSEKKSRHEKRNRSRSASLDRDERREMKKKAKERAKKEEKLAGMSAQEREERRKTKRLQSTAERFGYTNDSNPFGDSNLSDQFVWKKKLVKEGGSSSLPSKVELRQVQRKNVEEIEKVRKRRLEREKEMEEMERLRAEESRLSEQQKYGDWMKKEEDFHLEQAKMRSKIRLVEGRQKPIDVLAKNVLLFGDATDESQVGIKYRGKNSLDLSHLEIELREPFELFRGLSLFDLRELSADIASYQELEASGPNKDFFDCLAVVCREELRKAEARAGSEDAEEARVHKSVLDKVHERLQNLSLEALVQTNDDISGKLQLGASDTGAVDVEYYEMVLRVVDMYIAKAKLHELHQSMLRCQLKRLELARIDLRKRREEARGKNEAATGEAEEGGEETDADGAIAKEAADESDMAKAMFINEARKGMEDLEDAFDLKDEVDLSGTKYSWSDKYRPRKPRFFNRVKTGYDWNKYNQAHYDHDNPPPKTVQGYKFNIFYPDLLDRTVAPKFFLEKAAGSDDFAILRFSAGPPYEDLAFQIMNREWEISKKKGFKSSFDRGVLTLCFNFKRARYRR